MGNPDYIYRPPSPGKNQEDLAKKAIVLEPGTEIRADTLETYLAQIDSTSSSPFTGLQTMNYSWHIRGGLLGINLNPSGNTVPDMTKGDLFSYKLDYETSGQWNGNIGKQSWNHVDGANPVGIRDYTYSYDSRNQLKSANYSGIETENYSIPNVNYDKNGNILQLQRNGKKGSDFGLMDNLTYTYSGNRLTKVTDVVGGNHEVDFVQRGSGNYTYYENGALKSDQNKEITNIVYNTFLNLPTEIYLTDGRWIKNTYLGDGTLVKREFSNGEVWEYNNGLIFKNGKFYSIQIPEGRLVYDTGDWKLEFYYEDHLGNKRVTFSGEDGTLVKKDNIDFDPWGVRLNGTDYRNSLENRFKYQDKESLYLFGLENINDFSARYLDRSIGRFWGVDPLADHPNQLGISSYAFTNNNPINMMDSDGRFPVPLITGGIGALGGLIYGLVKGKNWKETTALTSGGFVAGATMGFGTAGIAALGGIEAIGGAGATMITLGSGIVGGLLGNATEQGVKIVLGSSSFFDGNELILSGAFGMSEVVLGPAGEAIGGAAKNAVQRNLSDMFKQPSRAEIRSTQRELAKQLRSNAPPGSISKTDANKAAKQLVNAAQEKRTNTLQGTIRVSKKGVDVSVSAMQTTISEEMKNRINN